MFISGFTHFLLSNMIMKHGNSTRINLRENFSLRPFKFLFQNGYLLSLPPGPCIIYFPSLSLSFLIWIRKHRARSSSQIPCYSCIVLWRVLSFSLGRKQGSENPADVLALVCWPISVCPSSWCPWPILLGMGNSLMLPRASEEVKGSGLSRSSWLLNSKLLMPFLFSYHLEGAGCHRVLTKDTFREVSRNDSKTLPMVSQAEGWGTWG